MITRAVIPICRVLLLFMLAEHSLHLENWNKNPTISRSPVCIHIFSVRSQKFGGMMNILHRGGGTRINKTVSYSI